MRSGLIKKCNQTIAFFALTIAWLLTNLIYSIYKYWIYGKYIDGRVILFWSGLFIYIAWIIFIIYPLMKLNHEKHLFKKHIFPLATTIYAGLVFTLLIGSAFQNLMLIKMFFPLALLVGLIFGLLYSTLITNEKLIILLIKKPVLKLVLIASPYIIFFIIYS